MDAKDMGGCHDSFLDDRARPMFEFPSTDLAKGFGKIAVMTLEINWPVIVLTWLAHRLRRDTPLCSYWSAADVLRHIVFGALTSDLTTQQHLPRSTKKMNSRSCHL